MCWSLAGSIFFSVIQILLTSFLVWRAWFAERPFRGWELDAFIEHMDSEEREQAKRKEEEFFTLQDRWIFPLALTSLIIQLATIVQWVYVQPHVDLDNDSLTCPQLNRGATILIFVFITAHPLLLNLWGYQTCEKEMSPLFHFGCHMSLIVWLAFIIELAVGEISGIAIATPEWMANIDHKGMYGVVSCAYRGLLGRLHWVYRATNHYLAPNHFTYYLCIGIPLMFHRPRINGSAFVLFILFLYALTFLFFDFSYEAGSLFCLFGVLSEIFFLVLPYIKPHLQRFNMSVALQMNRIPSLRQ